MCIIISTKERKLVKEEWVDASWCSNSDGGGVAYPKDGKLHVVKGLMKLAEMKEEISKIPEDSPALLHFRIATSGGTNKKNTHPWRINDLTAMAHNGILSFPSTAELSDTGAFTHDVLIPMFMKDPEALESDYFKRWLTHYLGPNNSMSFIKADGTILNIAGAGNHSPQEEGHVWFSNRSYMPRIVRPVHVSTTAKGRSRQGSRSGGASGNAFKYFYFSGDVASARKTNGIPSLRAGVASYKAARAGALFQPKSSYFKMPEAANRFAIYTKMAICKIDLMIDAFATASGIPHNYVVVSGNLKESKPMPRQDMRTPGFVMSADWLHETCAMEGAFDRFKLNKPHPEQEPYFYVYSGSTKTIITLCLTKPEVNVIGNVVFLHNGDSRLIAGKGLKASTAIDIYNSRLGTKLDRTLALPIACVLDEESERTRYTIACPNTNTTLTFSKFSGLCSHNHSAGSSPAEVGYFVVDKLGASKKLLVIGSKEADLLGKRVPTDDFTIEVPDYDFVDWTEFAEKVIRDCNPGREDDVDPEWFECYQMVEPWHLEDKSLDMKGLYRTTYFDLKKDPKINSVEVTKHEADGHIKYSVEVEEIRDSDEYQVRVFDVFNNLGWYLGPDLG